MNKLCISISVAWHNPKHMLRHDIMGTLPFFIFYT
jgi:hypothetical protein